MPIDLEDRIEADLADLARSAPIPEHWPELGAPVIRLDGSTRRRFGRPRLVTAVVAAAAVILVVVGVLVVGRGSRVGHSTAVRVGATPGGSATTVFPPGTPMGQWDTNGPRLTDAQLAELVTPSTDSDGTTTWHLSDELAKRELNDVPLSSTVDVTKLTFVKVQLGKVNIGKFTGPDSKDLPQIQHYVDNEPPRNGRNVDQQVWLVAIEGNYFWSGSRCSGWAPDLPKSTRGCGPFEGMSVTAIPADEHDNDATHFMFGPIAGMQADFSAFDQVGHWTPN